MHIDQQRYRELHDAMLDRAGAPFEPSKLWAWLARNEQEPSWLEAFRQKNDPRAPASDDELWRLYALSRVIQLLTLSFQVGTADGSTWLGPGVSLADVTAFSRDLGLTVVEPQRFSPFDCEIVRATEAVDRDTFATIEDLHWPCLMLGHMLICRAGAAVRVGTNVFDTSIAESSTLYWAYRRKTRPYQDLSHGWGSNSQWRTRFRRDYMVGDELFFNVDGAHDLAGNARKAESGDGRRARHQALVSDSALTLTREERVELLTHRCFVRTATPHDSLWPYDDRLVMRR